MNVAMQYLRGKLKHIPHIQLLHQDTFGRHLNIIPKTNPIAQKIDGDYGVDETMGD
jgi:hypothetical protein